MYEYYLPHSVQLYYILPIIIDVRNYKDTV